MTELRPNRLLDSINSPADLKGRSRADIKQIAEEVRAEVIDVVAVTGGHLGSGLGVVELTVAIHTVFNAPDDKLVWDVGHQCYPHKILTGRRDRMRETITVAPGIEWVRMPLPFSLKFINLWLVDDGDSWTIVDTGLPLPETKSAWRKLLDARVTPGKPLKRVIITHMHPDHVGSAGWLCHKYGAELWMSRLEYITCRMLVADTGRQAPPVAIDFYRRSGWDDAALEHYKSRFGGFGRGVSLMPDAYFRLSDGDELKMAGARWQVITGAGHSPEHVCLFSPDLNILISHCVHLQNVQRVARTTSADFRCLHQLDYHSASITPIRDMESRWPTTPQLMK